MEKLLFHSESLLQDALFLMSHLEETCHAHVRVAKNLKIATGNSIKRFWGTK
jgi:hypothetical protein